MLKFLLLVISLITAKAATTNTAASVARSDVLAAYNLSSSGDTILIPAGTATWTSPITVTKYLSIIGAGTNLTHIINNQPRVDGQEQPIFNIKLSTDGFCRVSGIHIEQNDGNSTAAGLLINGEAGPHMTSIMVDNMLFNKLDRGIMAWSAFGVCYDSHFLQNRVSFRLAGYSTTNKLYQIAFPPWAWNSTNSFVYEDCLFEYAMSTSDRYISDTEYPAPYTVRFCDFWITYSGNVGMDGHDMHGVVNGNQVRLVGLHIYGNRWHTIGATSVNPFNIAGIRGGAYSLVYSNTCEGLLNMNIGLSDNPTSGLLMTQTYIWENYGGVIGTTPASIGAINGVTLGINYFTSAPAGFSQLTYPHPLRGITPPPTPPATNQFNLITIRGGMKVRGNLKAK